MPVQLPYSHSASVVLGSAMLGACAAKEFASTGEVKTQAEASERGVGMRERLWDIMVCGFVELVRETFC